MSTPSTPTPTQVSSKMALLKRPGNPPELIEEVVAADDARLTERYPGLLENALALRERFTSSGARVRDPKQANQGQLVVTIVCEAVLEIEGQRVWIEDLNDVRTEEKTRDTAVLLQTWARQALIEQVVETTATGPRAVIRVIKQAATKGGHGEAFRILNEGPETWSTAITLSWSLTRQEALGNLSPTQVFEQMEAIEAAITAGENDVSRTHASTETLKRGPAVPSPFLLIGF
jgi:hypothetical protein